MKSIPTSVLVASSKLVIGSMSPPWPCATKIPRLFSKNALILLAALALTILSSAQAPAAATLNLMAYRCINGTGFCQENVCYRDTVVWDNLRVDVAPGVQPGTYSVVSYTADPYVLQRVEIVVAADGSYTVQGDYWSGWGSSALNRSWGVEYLGAPFPDATVDADIAIYSEAICLEGATGVVRHGNVAVTLGSSVLPPDENQTKKCDISTECPGCSSKGMASYSIHMMMASLHIQDTPISYNSPRGPSTDFTVVYNQREANQPATFTYSNLGPKWTFNWLSYVTDDGSGGPSANPQVYVRSGGTEVYGGYDFSTQSYAPDKQTLAILVRTSSDTYEKRFPDGSTEVFSLPDGSGSPRRVFLTSVIDAAGNETTLTYERDGSFRITKITDSLKQSTTLSYELSADPSRITKVTDPFGRFAQFEYNGDGKQLSKIIDPVGIASEFFYEPKTDFIYMLRTPYGDTTFITGGDGNSSRWLEATDPLGGKERVEYNNSVSAIPSSELVAPSGVFNGGLNRRNTFYWDKKAMAEAPGDYTKARIIHWLKSADGKVSGIKGSEKLPLENRVWYSYDGGSNGVTVGTHALPKMIAQVLGDGTTQASWFQYNAIGRITIETDPVGRVTGYYYDTNSIDLLTVFQRNPAGLSVGPGGMDADVIASYTYNSLHERLTETDAAGQVTTYTYNTAGQILTRTNAKGEITTYVYGDGATTTPTGYLDAIIGPAFNGSSAITTFTYDSANRVQTVTNQPDQYTVTTDYDDIDRKTVVTYFDGTYEAFQYTDNVTNAMTLDLTASRDRLGRWTYRHYNANRQMDSITDENGHPTLYNWCTCGSLTSITDPNGNITTFHRDLQSRVHQKVFADGRTIDYLFDGQTAPNTSGATSRLKSVTNAGRRTNYSYFADGNISSVTYTNTGGSPLSPPTPPVNYSYDANYNRIETMTDGTGQTSYSYYSVGVPPGLGAGKLESINGPLDDDTIGLTYDELGRMLSQSINGVDETVAYDSIGRLTTTDNVLGHFSRAYYGVTSRLQTHTYPNGQTLNYTYFGNNDDLRLQTLQNLTTGGVNLSTFNYTYDDEGQIKSWNRQLGATSSGRWFEYDFARQLLSARNASDPVSATEVNGYVYDATGNRTSDTKAAPQSPTVQHNYTINELNQIDNFEIQAGPISTLVFDLTYDLAGNLLDDGQGKTFEWDAANRLIAVNYAGTNSRSEFTYDGLSRRVKIVEKTGSTVTSTKQFVWVGNRIAQERDENNTIMRQYFAEGEYGEKRYYYTRDHLGSIRELTGAQGGLLVRYDYDPYGQRTKLSGTADVDFGYTGHYHHAPSGLNLTLYRAYNPELGRWLSRDTLEDAELLEGPNLYAYVANNPMVWVDPTGQGIWKAIKCYRIIRKWDRECFSKLPDCRNPCGTTTDDKLEAILTCLKEHADKSQRCYEGLNQELVTAGCAAVSVGAPPGYLLKPPILP